MARLKGELCFYFVYYKLVVIILMLILKSDCASVRTADSKVYVVTPSSSEARDFPYFIPTPVYDNTGNRDSYKDDEYIARHPVYPSFDIDNSEIKKAKSTYAPFLPTPLPDETDLKARMPDIIMAEFKPENSGTMSGGKMISVKEMLSKETISTHLPKNNDQKTVLDRKQPSQGMNIEDVWDIIKHNQNLEAASPGEGNSMQKYKISSASNKIKASEILISPSVNSEYSYGQGSDSMLSAGPQDDSLISQKVEDSRKKASETTQVEIMPSISLDNNAWIDDDSKPVVTQSNTNDTLQIGQVDEPRTIRGNANMWDFPNSRNPARAGYYPGYKDYNSNYFYADGSNNDDSYNIGVAQDRFNPAQPYLPPKPDSSSKSKPLPAPPAPMPPPPPPPKPQESMAPPPLSFDSSSSSQDDSSPPDTNGYQYSPPTGNDDLGNYPQFLYDDHHDSHHHDDYHFYHHHHHPPPTMPTTTTTTTPAPQKRENNRFSYYYLGKKLWYLPLYFSVYFIIYVGALIIKSIARHKITYPQHYKTKRAIEGITSHEIINDLTRYTTNAIMKMAEKYRT